MADVPFIPVPYRVKDLRGVLFGQLTPIRYLFTNKNRQAVWECRCKCGNLKEATSPNLERGHTKSCGCLYASTRKTGTTTHGGCYDPEYGCWRGMMKRCYNPKHISYPEYGAKGIIVCERWHHYLTFRSDMGPRPSLNHSLHRFPNTSGNYEPGNVKWADHLEQQRNLKSNITLTFEGRTAIISEWTEIKGWSRSKIQNRRRAGWTDERILGTP